MAGRDRDENHRAASPLELLFDLTFVVAFGTAANELAHELADEHIASALIGFAFVTFAISWAWINFTWFASAFDTDDWIYRLLTMVQMVGVLVLALGIPDVFASVQDAQYLDNKTMVLGYVVMRVPMVLQWLRASKSSDFVAVGRTYAGFIVVAQIGWIILAFAQTSLLTTVVLSLVLFAVELGGPLFAETRRGGTPWHPHHIAERYGLLIIIALGEGMIGTIAGLRVVLELNGWSTELVLIAFAGVALTFGIWWTYFVIPSGEMLSRHRERSFTWGYGHIPMFGAVVAVGAGLHVTAYYLEHHYPLGELGTVLSVLVPTMIYIVGLHVLYANLTRTAHQLHGQLLAASALFAVAAVLLVRADVPVEWCLLVVAAIPWITVVGYEWRGHRHASVALASNWTTDETEVSVTEFPDNLRS